MNAEKKDTHDHLKSEVAMQKLMNVKYVKKANEI